MKRHTHSSETATGRGKSLARAAVSRGSARPFGEDAPRPPAMRFGGASSFADHEPLGLEEEANAAAAEAEESSQSADDALGLYLRQMGAIPLLSRQEELTLATRLERARTRFRHAALFNWRILGQVVETFERIVEGRLGVDPIIDVVATLNLTREAILKRAPYNLRTLRMLLARAQRDFKVLQRTHSISGQQRLRRALGRTLRKCARLAAELSPRTELLERWVEELRGQSAAVQNLVRRCNTPGRSLAARQDRNKAVKELRDLLSELMTAPDELARMLHILQRRQQDYQKARRELAEGNLRLVVSIAKRYRGRGLPFADLIQEGNRGLMRAVDKYEHRLGFKFGTYATWWIRQGITRALADNARTVRVPCHQIGTLAALERVRGELAVELGREPTVEEIAKVLKVTPEDARSLRVVGRHPVSLHEPLVGEGERALEDFLSDPNIANPGAEADQHLLKERISEVLRSLAPREREVIELRFGLKDGMPRTLDEVAQTYGITRERIRQIEARGLLKLRQPGRSNRLAEFADQE